MLITDTTPPNASSTAHSEQASVFTEGESQALLHSPHVLELLVRHHRMQAGGATDGAGAARITELQRMFDAAAQNRTDYPAILHVAHAAYRRAADFDKADDITLARL
jgi:hypothetical protein